MNYTLVLAYYYNTKHTSAFDLPTCSFRKRNCRFKLLTSIVSKSIWKKPNAHIYTTNALEKKQNISKYNVYQLKLWF